jgi:glycogen operon protein
MRDFWRSRTNAASFASRFTGSSDLYQDDGRHPSASINFVTAHDGFTLADLVSYERKHNEPNLEGNRDGRDDNRSWNCGVEGPTDDGEILALRALQQRNFLTTLLLSQGVPMILGGDERWRTQGGNNNAWCQDNPTSWFDWELDERRENLLEFTRRLVALRRRHPAFRRTDFLDGGPKESLLPDAWWFRPDGRPMAQREWQTPEMRELGVFLNGEELGLTTTGGEPVVDDSFAVLLNATPEDVVFRLPPRRFGLEWELVLSTANPDLEADRLPGRSALEVPARSCSLLRRVR